MNSSLDSYGLFKDSKVPFVPQPKGGAELISKFIFSINQYKCVSVNPLFRLCGITQTELLQAFNSIFRAKNSVKNK